MVKELAARVGPEVSLREIYKGLSNKVCFGKRMEKLEEMQCGSTLRYKQT